MADETQRAIDVYEGAVALVPGGVTVRDPSKLRSAATDRLVWQAVFGDRRGARGAPVAALGAGSGHRCPAGLDPRPVPGRAVGAR